MSDADLQAKTPEFRQRLDNGEDLDDLLVESYAVVREAAPGSSASATSTCSSWAVPRSTSGGSPR